MSFNRRRWSNGFLNSLIDFQSREDSDSVNRTILFDSSESKRMQISVDSLDNKCMDITSTLAVKYNSTTLVSLQTPIKESFISNLVISNFDNGLKKSKSFDNFINLSISKDPDISKDLISTSINDNVNRNINIIKNDTSEHLNIASSQVDHLFNLNESSKDNITASLDKTIKESSLDLSIKNSIEMQNVKTQCIENSTIGLEELVQLSDKLNTNEKTENIIPNSNNEILKLFSSNSNALSMENKSIHEANEHVIEISTQDKVNQRFFSTPVEPLTNNQEIISDMNKPDVWDTLLALEQALSPIEENVQNVEECSQEYSSLLNRLSQKFKKTPTRFTEQLVSIIEDSVISSESPTKQYSGNNSGISLHRMTGEFRKLCKFIEDESMPEWAPSLMNITGSGFENTETPKYKIENKNFNATSKNILKLINDTPNRRMSSKVFKNFVTPKNKIISNINSPVNQFTPTADKSFEYWERVCNMMCDNKANTIKNSINSTESSKVSMNEMLTICERQMASLDDSTIDIRSSEPCKKLDSDLKTKVIQALRSKSESKIIFDTNEIKGQSPKKKKDEKVNTDNDYSFIKEYMDLKINDKLVFDNESNLKSNKDLEQSIEKVYENFEILSNKELKENDQEIFEKDFELLLYSPVESSKTEINEDSCSDNEQDCSLLIELAKRRQRCLDTAKLMLEIDSEDPINNEESKCLETLYKLGIQDKTFTEVEDDTKFLNTLSQCIDYKNYITVKSKPLVNMLNEFNSPADLKNKTLIKSKQLLNHRYPSYYKAKNCQKSVLTKSRPETKSSSKKVQDKKITSKLISKLNIKTVPKVVKKVSNLIDLQQTKDTPKLNKPGSDLSDLQKIKVTPREILKTSVQRAPHINKHNLKMKTEQKTTQKIMSKSSVKVPLIDQRSYAQSKKLTPKVVSKVLVKTTPQLEHETMALKVTSKFSSSKITPHVAVDDRNSNSPLPPKIHQNEILQSPKVRLFLTPGKSPKTSTLGRKKPPAYFFDEVSKKTTPLKSDYNSIKSPISLYIHGTDTDLIQNVHGRINDRLLTPVSKGNAEKSPKLKFTLSSKENKSPNNTCTKDIILPTVRYQSAKKVRLIDDKSSYSPSSLTPNSKTKKLLGPIENTVVIRHEGRVLDESLKSEFIASETSIRVQKMAEKTISTRKRCV